MRLACEFDDVSHPEIDYERGEKDAESGRRCVQTRGRAEVMVAFLKTV